jgi:hypothetical protein
MGDRPLLGELKKAAPPWCGCCWRGGPTPPSPTTLHSPDRASLGGIGDRAVPPGPPQRRRHHQPPRQAGQDGTVVGLPARGRVDVVRALLEKGADPTIADNTAGPRWPWPS